MKTQAYLRRVASERSSAEIRAEIIQHLINLAPILEIEALPELEGTAIAIPF